MMLPVLRLLLAGLVVCMCIVTVPAWAQSYDGGSGSYVAGSDVAGVLSQVDLLREGGEVRFASVSVQKRVNAAATTLNRRLRQGTMISAITVPAEMREASTPGLATLLAASGDRTTVAERQQLVVALTRRGIPPEQAYALAQSLTGLMAGDQVEAGQLVRALEAYNAAVDVAPAAFLKAPLRSFVVLRRVLNTLLQATAS